MTSPTEPGREVLQRFGIGYAARLIAPLARALDATLLPGSESGLWWEIEHWHDTTGIPHAPTVVIRWIRPDAPDMGLEFPLQWRELAHLAELNDQEAWGDYARRVCESIIRIVARQQYLRTIGEEAP